MTKTKIIDGRAIAKEIQNDLTKKIQVLVDKNLVPQMAVVHIGDNPSTLSYIKSITKISLRLNINAEVYRIDKTESTNSAIKIIESLNQDSNINGIILQEPIPRSFEKGKIINAISPGKDIDCMTTSNLGRLMEGNFLFAPSTPLGVLKILEFEQIDVEGKHTVIIGRSNIVGKPLANLLLMKRKIGNATVTVCHSRTVNLKDFTRSADILIVAIGKPNFIKGEMIKNGAVVIDVGINYIKDRDGKHKLVGDVDTDSVTGIASFVTPVPGGVGPVTTMMLFDNLIKAIPNG